MRNLKPLNEIAAGAGIPEDCLEPYGAGAAKVSLGAWPTALGTVTSWYR